MFNSYSNKNSFHAGNININAISGTLVKNYQKSFFINVKSGSTLFKQLFEETEPYLEVNYNTPGCYKVHKSYERYGYGESSETFYYRKSVVVIQAMIVADGVYMTELMWKEDFDKLFEIGEQINEQE